MPRAPQKTCTLPEDSWLAEQQHWPSGDPVYTDEERRTIGGMRPAINAIAQEDRRREIGSEFLRDLWPDSATFIRKQHWIGTKGSTPTLLQWNYVQRGFYALVAKLTAEGRPVRIITLKARQLGQSTGIQSYHYEQCHRFAHHVAATVSYDDASTTEMFAKAHFLHHRLWFPPRTRFLQQGLIELANGSKFLTSTAGNVNTGRSYTYHHLHISELPAWQADVMVLDGLLQAVPRESNTSVFIEATAQGTANEFHLMWTRAEKGEGEFVPYFAPWFWDPAYRKELPPSMERGFLRRMRPDDREYMEQHELDVQQMAWRREKIDTDLRGSLLKFQQEFPATPQEAFIASGFPAFNQRALAELAQNVAPPRFRGNVFLLRPGDEVA